jgi:hypothetical protein
VVRKNDIQQGAAYSWNPRKNLRKPPQEPNKFICSWRAAYSCRQKIGVLTSFSDQDSPVGATMKNTFFKNMFRLTNEVSVFQKV